MNIVSLFALFQLVTDFVLGRINSGYHSTRKPFPELPKPPVHLQRKLGISHLSSALYNCQFPNSIEDWSAWDNLQERP
jgi:hypothetical protein